MGREAWFGQREWAQAWARRAPLTAHLVPLVHAELGPRPGERILDAGTGDGQLATSVARAVAPGGRVMGVDISAPMLEIAATSSEVIPGLGFHQCDAATATIPGAPFDAITSLLGVMFFDDPVAAFANLCSHARPGGRLAAGCWGARDENPLLPESLLQRFLAPTGWSDADLMGGSFSLADASRAIEVLTGAGWHGAQVTTHELSPVLPEAAIFDDDLLDLYRVPHSLRASATAHVQRTIERHRTPEGIRTPLSLNLLTAVAD